MVEVKKYLFEARSARPLALFRILFSLLMLYDVLRLVREDVLIVYFKNSAQTYPYPLLEWIKPLPYEGMVILFGVMIVALLMMLIGWKFKWGTIAFYLTWTYFFLLDMSYYNNHYYAISIMSFLFIFSDADEAYSFKTAKKHCVPQWNYSIFQFIIIAIYFYGGIAKIQTDWLVHHEPIKELLRHASAQYPSFRLLLTSALAEYFFVWGGLLFDLMGGIMLLFRRTRFSAIMGVLIFNISNHLIFDDIFIFPFIMISALLFFIPAKKIDNLFGIVWDGKKINKSTSAPFEVNRFTLVFLAVFASFNLLFPFKHFLIQGNSDWTGEAQKFCWHMKSQTRKVKTIAFRVHDNTGNYQKDDFIWFVKEGKINRDIQKRFLINDAQINLMGYSPYAVHHFVKYLQKFLKEEVQIKDVSIYSNVVVSFNGHPFQELIDKKKDLTRVEYNYFRHNSWISPLDEKIK